MMIEFEDVRSGEAEERPLKAHETRSFHESAQNQGKRYDWIDDETAREVDIGGVFDEVTYRGITSINALIVDGSQELKGLPIDQVLAIVKRIFAARELLKKRGYLEEGYPIGNDSEYAYVFARRTPKAELAAEFDYLLNQFSTELDAALNSVQDPVQ